MLISSWKSSLLSGVLLAVLIGCGSEPKKASTPTHSPTPTKTGTTNTGDTGGDTVQPDAGDINIADMISQMKWDVSMPNNGKVYTGFNGTTPMKVWVFVALSGLLPENVVSKLKPEQLQAIYSSKEYQDKLKSDISKLEFQADSAYFTVKSREYAYGRIFELTTLKSGSAKAKATWGTKELPMTVTIANYTTAQLNAGRNRYNNAVTGATPSPSCASCHSAAGGFDHSPLTMSIVSDAAMLTFIETGKNPEFNLESNKPHKMTFANATDKAGIVAYLRSLEPSKLPPESGEIPAGVAGF